MTAHGCPGAMQNGPAKRRVQCSVCGAIDCEKNEGDRCGGTRTGESLGGGGPFEVRTLASGRLEHVAATREAAQAYADVLRAQLGIATVVREVKP